MHLLELFIYLYILFCDEDNRQRSYTGGHAGSGCCGGTVYYVYGQKKTCESIIRKYKGRKPVSFDRFFMTVLQNTKIP